MGAVRSAWQGRLPTRRGERMNGIKKILAERGLVDTITIDVDITVDVNVGEQRVFLTRWDGVLAFYRNEVAEYQAGPKEGRVVLPAVWQPGEHDVRLVARTNRLMTFRVECPGDALERLEGFRAGGRLYARLEGRFQHLSLGRMNGNGSDPIEGLLHSLVNPQRVLWMDIKGEALEVSRDRWIAEVLNILRDPAHVVLEARLPVAHVDADAGKRALAELQEAQSEFDHGRFVPCAAAVYRALEAIQSCGSRLDRYGAFGGRFIADQSKATRSAANECRRHDEAKLGREPTPIDRALALHLLLTAKSLLALTFAATSE